MSKAPAPVKALVFTLVLAVVSFVAYQVLVAPKQRQADSLARQIDEARSQIEIAQGGPGPDGTPPIRVADLFRLSRAMPDRPDLPNILLQLSAIASETGITFESITPHDPELIGAYRRIPIDLVFQGHFYDLSDFLYRLRNLVGVHDGQLDAVGRLFAVQSVSFQEGELKFPQVRAQLTVDAFEYGASNESGPAPTQTETTAPESTVSPTDSGTQPIPAVPPGLSSQTQAGA